MTTFYHKSKPSSVIRVTGEDAEDYLQSQWTLNVKKLASNSIGYGLRLSTKGKVLADSYFFRLGEEEFILLSRECGGKEIISLLNENIVADEVEFVDESMKWEWITVWSENNESSKPISDLPSFGPGKFANYKEGYVFEDFCISKNTHGYLVPINSNLQFMQGQQATDYQLIEKKIISGLPSVPKDIGSTELPQEGCLEDYAIDFNKGCYLGQEVMARIHAMGRVRRQTFPISWKGKEIPSLPCPVYAKEKNIGSLKSMIPSKTHGFIGTAIIHENAIEELKNSGLVISKKDNERIFLLK